MAFKNLIAFGAGEITQELSERGNLEKFRTGLRRLRNGRVTKMGGLSDRAGTEICQGTVMAPESKMYIAGSSGRVIIAEKQLYRFMYDFNPSTKIFGTSIFYYYEPDAVALDPDYITYSAASVENMVFSHSDNYIYIFSGSARVFRIDIKTGVGNFLDLGFDVPDVVADSSFFTSANNTVAPTGYFVEYLMTGVKDGVELPDILHKTNASFKIPAGTNQGTDLSLTYIDLTFDNTTNTILTSNPTYDSVKFYRRPAGAGEYGFIGESVGTTTDVAVGTTTTRKMSYKFSDFGGAADFTSSPPRLLDMFVRDAILTMPPSVIPLPEPIIPRPSIGLLYQNRIIFNGTKNKASVFGTKTDTSFMIRDYPLQDDSAVGFNVTSDGGGDIHRFFDGRGLIIATNVGMYETPSDVLKYNTAYAIKKSSIIHKKGLPMLGTNSSMIVYDDRLKGIYRLTPNGDNYPYTDEELSVFSAHMFRDRNVVSWDIQNDFTQLFWMVMDDGTLVNLAYQNDQLLRAFSTHDTDGEFKEVGVMKVPNGKDIVFFKVKRGNLYHMEMLSDRDESRFAYMNFADSSVIQDYRFVNQPTIYIPEDKNLDDSLYMTISAFEPFADLPFRGAEGTVFRVFNDNYNNYIDVVVEEYISNTLLKVRMVAGIDGQDLEDKHIPHTISDISPTTINGEIVDKTLTSPVNNWKYTRNVISNLSHLEGRKVSIRMDGYTVSSPLNTERDYDEYVVTGGQITLKEGEYGSIFVVGLPYVVDIRTLQVDTIEQAPVKLNSQITNKVWLSFNESRGCYLGSEFPSDGTVKGMENSEDMRVTDGQLDVNRPITPYSDRQEYAMVGDWNTSSSICIRKVDPQPLGLKAIILDSEIIR